MRSGTSLVARIAAQFLAGSANALEERADDVGELLPSIGEQLARRVSADFRDLSEWPRSKSYPWREFGWPSDKSRARPRGSLRLSRLHTLVLHTTDTGGLHPKRFLGIPAHGGIDKAGGIVLMHHPTRYLYHAHAANRYSNGLEISGRGTITSEQIVSARIYLRWWRERILELRRGAGIDEGEPLYIIPHRHSHSSRRFDPGQAVWQAVGEWALDEGLFRLGRVYGSGIRIPRDGAPW